MGNPSTVACCSRAEAAAAAVAIAGFVLMFLEACLAGKQLVVPRPAGARKVGCDRVDKDGLERTENRSEL